MASEVVEYHGSNPENLNNEQASSSQTQLCAGFRNWCNDCSKPCQAESHPLPRDAGCCRRLLDNLLCPPHAQLGAILFVIIFAATFWATLYAMTGDEALPGGNLFSLSILFLACWCGGYIFHYIYLPPLLGMLVVGVLLGNVPHISYAKDIDSTWSSSCRQIALAIILIQAGLGLDPAALCRLSCVVIRLAFAPCLVEAFVDGFASHFILGFPWAWGFMLGFVIAAVSPAVVVPSLLSLADKGYGLEKGVPTLVIAAASIDDVLAITGFGVMMGIAFSSGNLVLTLAKGPLEALAGIAIGVVGGFILWYIPQRKSGHRLLFRSSLLVCLSLMALFGSRKVDFAGAGPLAALTMPFVAALRWRSELKEGEKNPVEGVIATLWMIFQPLLFGLIGAEVKISALDGDSVGLGLAVLGIGLICRSVTAFFAVFGANLNTKERLFIPIAWFPKATVQAAIGAVALDRAKEINDPEAIKRGDEILTLAVLSILVTAPLGAAEISLAGPRLLKRRGSQDADADGEGKTKGADVSLTSGMFFFGYFSRSRKIAEVK